jgi:hypothetical protein
MFFSLIFGKGEKLRESSVLGWVAQVGDKSELCFTCLGLAFSFDFFHLTEGHGPELTRK